MAAAAAVLHHLAAFTLVAALAVEAVFVNSALTAKTARILQRADMILGAAAVVLLIVGLARVFHFEKGWAYYSASVPFIAKFSLFIIVALLSSYPTLVFLSWRNPLKLGDVLARPDDGLRPVRTLIYLELAGVILIILFAALMAKGIGLWSSSWGAPNSDRHHIRGFAALHSAHAALHLKRENGGPSTKCRWYDRRLLRDGLSESSHN
jgi:putative membrane protein